MTYNFEIDGRKIRVDWDGSRLSPATVTDNKGNRIDFPRRLAPYSALSKLDSPSPDEKLKGQRAILNCLEAASIKMW